MKKVMTVLRIVVFATVLLALVTYGLYRFNVFVFDDSAVPSGNGIEWNGARYVPCEGKYELGKAFAKMNGDDARVLYAIEGDDSYRYFVAKAMRDPQLYVREDLSSLQNKTVTGVYLYDRYEDDPVIVKTVCDLFSLDGTIPFDDEELMFRGDHNTEVVLCFDGSPIGTHSAGLLFGDDVWKAVQHLDGETQYQSLTEEQIDIVDTYLYRILNVKLIPILAVVVAVVVVTVITSVRKYKKNGTRFREVHIMKKNTHCFIMIIVLLIFLTSCDATKNWKTIEINGYGNIKVPGNWEYSVVDGFEHFSLTDSKDNTPILIQYSREDDKGDTEEYDVEYNEYFADIEDMVWVYDEFYSNGTSIIKYKVCYHEGNSRELFVLELYRDIPTSDVPKLTEFICVDDSVPEETLKKIAKSFAYEYNSKG